LNNKSSFVIVIFIFLFSTTSSHALDAGEHALIGDLAFKQNLLNYPNDIKNLEADISFSYGQLVAMSADMYISVEELALNDPGILNGFFNRNRKSLKRCIDKEVENIRTKRIYSGCDDLEFAKKKIQYVALAHDNYGHFAWHNIKRYVELHTKALWFANLAYLKCSKLEWQKVNIRCGKNKKKLTTLIANSNYKKKQKTKYRKLPKLFPRKRFTKNYFSKMTKEKMIRLALFTNAYADHYLTDAFSAGHLRVPRSQIDIFVVHYAGNKNKNKREKGSSLSGALTQYLHNLDGSLKGIAVTNSLGYKFTIRSDKQLFSKINSQELSGIVETNKQITQPLAATKASISEIFNVITHGEKSMPLANFKALEYVPYRIDPTKDSLASQVKLHIEQHGSIKKAIKSMSSEMQIIFRSSMLIDNISYKEYFKDFSLSIPSMMKKLQVQIKKESKNIILKKRIPSSLLKALKVLN